MQPNGLLPAFNYHGFLPEGIHDTTFDVLRERFVINPQRVALWERLEAFLKEALAYDTFSYVYIDGGFITGKAAPEDIDIILQTKVPYGAEAFKAMEPFFVEQWSRLPTIVTYASNGLEHSESHNKCVWLTSRHTVYGDRNLKW
jgi:hypothetical protein